MTGPERLSGAVSDDIVERARCVARQRDGLLFVQGHRWQAGAGGELVAAFHPARGVHRTFEIAEPLHVPARGGTETSRRPAGPLLCSGRS